MKSKALAVVLILIIANISCKKKSSPAIEGKTEPTITPTPVATVENPLAFPGAEGFGKDATGGRGGMVIEVTNLNDSGVGSLRAAVSATGARYVIFKVSGRIDLKTTLTIKNGSITIAGQTAPGDGICLSGNTLSIDADNVIIRYLRSRLGNEFLAENDAMNARNHQNIIIDHCSLSWSIDETGSFYDNKNFTLQWCILSESLYNGGHSKGVHGYAGIWGGQNVSFHHNLIANHVSRTPRFCGSRYTGKPDLEIVDFRNNVVYNWGDINSAYGNEGGNINMVNNYFKAGPATPGSLSSSSTTNKRNRIFQYTGFYFDTDSKIYPDTLFGGKYYVSGNYVHGYPDVSADNISKGVQKDSYSRSAQLMASNKQTSPFSFGTLTTQTAEEAFISVLDNAGAVLPKRDAVDIRVVNEARTGINQFEGAAYKLKVAAGITHPSGIIDNQNDVGGWPIYKSTPAPIDTDHDGMPDEWERAKGLNPNVNDANKKDLSTAYDNLEVYINSLK